MRGNPESQKKENLEMNQPMLISIFIILLIFAATEVRAEEVAALQTSQIQIEQVTPQSDTKKFSLLISLGHDSNLSSNSNPDKDQSSSMIVNPRYKFSEKTELEARIDFIKSYDSEGKTSATNTAVVFTPTKIDLSKEINFSPEVSATLPTDKFARDDETYRGSISFRPTLRYAPEKVKGLAFMNRIYISKGFHEYEIKRDYSPNVEYSVRNRFAVSYMFTEKLGIESVNDFTKAWSYNGYSKDSFYFAQSIGYEFVKNWSASISHKNEGAARGPNNHGENVDLFASKSSYLGVEVSHVF